jgi:CHAT domain-containing protein
MRTNCLISLLLLFSLHLLSAKEVPIEAFFAKLDKAFRSGDYKGGRKMLLQNRGNLTAKEGTEGYPNARAYCHEARFMVALDRFEDFQVNIDAANKILNKTPNDRFDDYALAISDLCEAYIAFNEYENAEKNLSRLRKLKTEQKISSEYVLVKIDYLTIKILLLQGYTNQVIKQIEPTLLKAQNLRSIKGKFSKDELYVRNAIYAELKLMQGIAQFENGELVSAESIFNTTIQWAKQNTGGIDGSLAMAYYYQGLIKLELDDLQGANSKLQLAESNAKKAFKPGAENYIVIQETLIPVLKKLEKHKEAQIHNNAMDASINDYYGRKGYHFQRNKISDIRRDIINENYSRAQKDLTELAYQNSEIPKNHLFRSTLCEMLYYLYLRQNLYEQAFSNLQESIRIKKEKYGENAPNYHTALLKLAEYDYLYQDNFKEAEEIFTKSLEQIIRTEKGRKSKNFFSYLYMEISMFEITDRYEKAYKLMKEAHKETENLFTNSSLQYAASESKYAHLDIKAGNYLDAEKKINHAESIFNNFKSENFTPAQVELLESKSELLLILGQFEEAETALRKSINLYKKSGGAELKLTSNMEEKAKIDMYYGRFNATETELTALISGREKKFGSKSRSLIKPLQLMSSLKKTTGDYLEAERNIDKALKISKEVFGENSVNYAENLEVLTQLNASVGDYEKAEKNAQTAYVILKSLLGSNHIKTSIAQSKLALMKLYNGRKPEEIKPLFTESLSNSQKLLGNDNPLVAEIQENYSYLLLEMKEYTQAEEYISNAIKIWENRLGTTNLHAAELYRFKGTINFRQKKFNLAKENYIKSKKLFGDIFDDTHTEYIHSLGLSARAYYVLGENKNAIEASEETVDKSLLYLQKVFPALSERGKALYWEKVKEDFEFYKTLTFSSPNPSNSMVEKAFNISLQTKAILLNSSIKVRQRILASKDTSLISVYSNWLRKREELTSALGQSAAQRKEAGVEIPKLENEIEQLEKRLSQSTLFSGSETEKVYVWTDLKNVLKDKELIIEFSQFRKFHQGFTDSTWYVLMSVSNDTKGAPNFAIIKNGKEIDGKYLKYYRNCMKGEMDDEYSYDKYWKPLSPLLKKSYETIYLSLDGVYNQINLETIKLPEGSYVLNQYNLAIVSSSRDLLEKNASKTQKSKPTKGEVKLFGNPSYYSEESTLAKSISELPGAEAEVIQINNLLLAQKLNSQLYLNQSATEESIKKLSNPLVFHIATHGFFAQSKSQLQEDGSDPLLRSGLLLKNGGEIISNAKGYELNRTEGILTAKEAMNLALDSTSLVILSACETGLGEVSAGEGVFGLQRSFLVAGADNVVMSLFKVSDEATKDLMLEFYKRWLETGDKRKSFLEAKKVIQTKYKSPKYWGSFLIIGY